MGGESIKVLVSCKDARGVIAGVTEFVASAGGNVIDLDQHVDVDEQVFVMRLEVERGTVEGSPEAFERAFAGVEARFGLKTRIEWAERPRRIGVMVSKEGHCLSDLLWRWRDGELGAEVAVVISNHETLRAMAERAGVAFRHIGVTPVTKPRAEREARRVLAEEGVDVLVLARYMQVLGEDFAAAWDGRAINIHHSFLPAFAGARPYHRAHERGVKLIGATAHYVTADLDEGPIIAQRTSPVSHRDGVEDLKRIGRDLERITLAEAIRLHVQDRVLRVGRRTVVFR